jgi:poly(A) polymerase
MLDIILELARIFRAANRELYMVGGTVRDLLLLHTSSPDIDLATDARPDEIKRLVAQSHPAAVISVGEQFGTIRLHYEAEAQRFTAEDAESAEPERAVGGALGAEAPEHRDGGLKSPLGPTQSADYSPPGPSAGTSAPGSPSALSVGSAVQSDSGSPEPVALVAETPRGMVIVEITTYRSDVYNPDSRKPAVTFGDTLEDDLLRRDFTINAMARDPLTGAIIDPFGGREDLARKLIRAVGDQPERRFDEDPLRMLRACRFAAQLDFEIERKTAEAIRRAAPTLAKISRERIRDEFTKLLLTANPMRGLRLTVTLGLMPYIVPEVLELRGVSQAPAHSKDVYEHVLRVIARTPPRAAARWAGLLHDIAKPRTKSVEDGKVHFYGHEDVGAHIAREILRRLKFDRPFIDHVSLLVRMHMRANAYAPDWTDGAVRRLMLEADGALQDLLDLSRADITSYRQDKVSRAEARVNELAARCQWLREEAERVPLKSPLDGNELMELFARPPGAWIRPIKDHLLDLVIDGQLAPDDKETAAAEARRKMAELDAADPTPGPFPTGRGEAETPPPAPSPRREGGRGAPPTPPAEREGGITSGTPGGTAEGNAERRAAAKRGAEGVEIDETSWRDITEAARAVGATDAEIAAAIG